MQKAASAIRHLLAGGGMFWAGSEWDAAKFHAVMEKLSAHDQGVIYGAAVALIMGVWSISRHD